MPTIEVSEETKTLLNVKMAEYIRKYKPTKKPTYDKIIQEAIK